MTTVYGVTGMPLSGKTTVAEIMGEKGFTVLDMGEIVRIEMDKRNVSTENTGDFVNQMREVHGMDAIAQLTTPYLKEIIKEKENIVITGMRSWDEKQKLENETGDEIEIISVWTAREERKQRREERQREEDRVGQSFHKRDLRELKYGVGKLIALSDYMIENHNISLNDLEEEVDEIVK